MYMLYSTEVLYLVSLPHHVNTTKYFVVYFLNFGFTACQDYFTHYEQRQTLGQAKT